MTKPGQDKTARLSGREISPVKIISVLIFTVLLATISYLIYQNKDDLSLIFQTDWRYWAGAFIAYLIVNWLKGYSAVVLLKTIGIKMPYYESFILQNFSTLTNYSLPFQGGIGFRVLYMQRVYGVDYKIFFPISIATLILATGIYGVLAGLAASIHAVPYTPFYRLVLLLFTGGAFVLILVPIIAPYMIQHHWPFGSFLKRILAGWEIFVKSRSALIEWIISVIIRAAMEILVFYLACQAFDIDLDIWQIAVITLAKECSILIKLTPGAFGISEGVVAFFAAVYGVSIFQMILVALGVRMIEIIAAGFFGLISYPHISQKLIEAGKTTVTDKGTDQDR